MDVPCRQCGAVSDGLWEHDTHMRGEHDCPAVYRAESGNEYRTAGRHVAVKYAGWPWEPPLILTFPTMAEAHSYASQHGRKVA